MRQRRLASGSMQIRESAAVRMDGVVQKRSEAELANSPFSQSKRP